MKKVVNVYFSNFWPNFSINQLGPAFNNNPYLNKAGIQINVIQDETKLFSPKQNEKPDVVFFGVFGDFIEQSCLCVNDVLKVLFITEPISPDFTFFDYCMSFEPFDFDGRNCYYPDFVYLFSEQSKLFKKKGAQNAKALMCDKSVFCEMIYAHDGEDLSRSHYFNLLSKYKKVESAGTFLNNQPENKAVHYLYGDQSKFFFQCKSKFSICIQSVKKNWFINEKIMHSFMANEIPIYYGNEKVKDVFNPNRFIYIEDYKNDDELLSKIIEIDSDDEYFCSIISQPVFNNERFIEETIDIACKFVYELLSGIKKKQLIGKNREELLAKLERNKNNRLKKLDAIESNVFYKMLFKIKTIFKHN